MRGLGGIYVQQFKTTLASFIQYRAALVIWLIGHVLEPLIYLVVWSTVSRSSGGSVGGFTAAFAAALAAGGIIVYSFWLMLATLSFWFVRVENILQIFSSMYEAGRWPVSFYPRWLRFILTFLIPVAFATTVPAQALAGRLTWRTLAGAFALGAALLVMSRAFWRIGIRRYSSASS